RVVAAADIDPLADQEPVEVSFGRAARAGLTGLLTHDPRETSQASVAAPDEKRLTVRERGDLETPREQVRDGPRSLAPDGGQLPARRRARRMRVVEEHQADRGERRQRRNHLRERARLAGIPVEVVEAVD